MSRESNESISYGRFQYVSFRIGQNKKKRKDIEGVNIVIIRLDSIRNYKVYIYAYICTYIYTHTCIPPFFWFVHGPLIKNIWKILKKEILQVTFKFILKFKINNYNIRKPTLTKLGNISEVIYVLKRKSQIIQETMKKRTSYTNICGIQESCN